MLDPIIPLSTSSQPVICAVSVPSPTHTFTMNRRIASSTSNNRGAMAMVVPAREQDRTAVPEQRRRLLGDNNNRPASTSHSNWSRVKLCNVENVYLNVVDPALRASSSSSFSSSEMKDKLACGDNNSKQAAADDTGAVEDHATDPNSPIAVAVVRHRSGIMKRLNDNSTAVAASPVSVVVTADLTDDDKENRFHLLPYIPNVDDDDGDDDDAAASETAVTEQTAGYTSSSIDDKIADQVGHEDGLDRHLCTESHDNLSIGTNQCLIDNKENHLPFIPNGDTATATATATTSNKKMVRFFVDDNDEIVEQLSRHSFARYRLSEQDKRMCWYSKKERNAFKQGIPMECRDLARAFPQYRRAALKLFAAASYSSCRHDDWVRHYCDFLDGAEEEKTSTNYVRGIAVPLRILGDPQLRGLERAMFARMLLPRRSCKPNVLAVLRTQQLFRELAACSNSSGSGTMLYTDDEKAALIADQYAENAAFHVRWSILLALL
jgi:hypothetical protein